MARKQHRLGPKKDLPHVKWSNPRMEKFVSGLASGLEVREAGLKAGYSKNYVKTRIYGMMRTSKSFAQLVSQYATNSRGLIKDLYAVNLAPRAFNVDSKVVSKMEADPELAMKYPQSLTRIHKIGGTLEDQPVIQFVDLKVMNFIQQEHQKDLEAQFPGLCRDDGEDIVDAEVIEDSNE